MVSVSCWLAVGEEEVVSVSRQLSVEKEATRIQGIFQSSSCSLVTGKADRFGKAELTRAFPSTDNWQLTLTTSSSPTDNFLGRQIECLVLLRLGFGDFAQREETVQESENGANLIEDHRMHDAKAGQKRSTNANDVGDDNQTPTSVDVLLEIL